MAMKKQRKIPGRISKYNWGEIRQEFIRGDYKNVAESLAVKHIPAFYAKHKNMFGVVGEKKEYQKQVVAQAAEKSLQEDVEDATKVRLRQARLARYIQLKGAEALKDPTLKITSADEARKLLVSGLEQERKALGLEGGDKPNSLTQININTGPKTQLDRMLEGATYEDILGLIAELKRSRAGRTVSEIDAGSATEAEGVVS